MCNVYKTNTAASHKNCIKYSDEMLFWDKTERQICLANRGLNDCCFDYKKSTQFILQHRHFKDTRLEVFRLVGFQVFFGALLISSSDSVAKSSFCRTEVCVKIRLIELRGLDYLACISEESVWFQANNIDERFKIRS